MNKQKKKKSNLLKKWTKGTLTVHKRTIDTWIKEIKIETRCHSLHVTFAKVEKKKNLGLASEVNIQFFSLVLSLLACQFSQKELGRFPISYFVTRKVRM